MTVQIIREDDARSVFDRLYVKSCNRTATG